MNKTRAERRRGQEARQGRRPVNVYHQGRNLLAAHLAPVSGEQAPLRALLERVDSEARAQ
ncbi:MAG TPA: hypothetical protein VF043_24055 [Ktedonobacteraceae bacterium]